MIAMTTPAWELIRAADPMASIDVAGASKGPAAQELLHRITAAAPYVPEQPSVDHDVLTGPDSWAGRGPGRGRGLLAGSAAAIVVLLVAVGVVAVRREHRTVTLPPDRQPTPAGYSKALLAELPLPTGARRVDQPPFTELEQFPSTGNGIVDARVAWWDVAGSFTAAVAQVGRARALPAHWDNSISSTGFPGPRSHGWVFEVRDPAARYVASVNVTVAAHGTSVGMVAQVDTWAIPVRTPAQVIAASTDSATFTFTGGGRSYSSRLTLTMSGARITTLAHEVNATPTYVVLAIASCPAPQGSVTVTFRSGSRRWSLDINDGSFLCNTPVLTGTDRASINLKPSTTLLTDVLAAAGLPADYFQR